MKILHVRSTVVQCVGAASFRVVEEALAALCMVYSVGIRECPRTDIGNRR